MKVLLVSSSSGSRGGGEIFLLYLAKGLKELGHQPILWCSVHERMDELAEKFEKFGEVVRQQYKNSYYERKTRAIGAYFDKNQSLAVLKSWEQVDPDIVHLNLQTPEDGLDLLRATKICKIPYLITVHITQSASSLGAKGGFLRDFFVRLAFSKLSKKIPLVTVSDQRKKELFSFLGGDLNHHRIYNGVPKQKNDHWLDRNELLKQQDWPEDALIVCVVARLTAQKNPLGFLGAANKLKEVIPNSRFIWVGDGVMKQEFESNAEQLGIRHLIHITGWIDNPESYLSMADVYLHPALYEGLPLAILEAMRQGVPCVLPKSLIQEAEVMNVNNVIELDEEGLWCSVLQNPSKRESLAKASLQLYKDHFTHLSMAQSYLDLYLSAKSCD